MRARTRFFSATPAVSSERNYHTADMVLVVFIILAVVIVVIATRSRQQSPTVVSIPVATVTPSALVPTPPLAALGIPALPGVDPDIGTVIHVMINEAERAALAVVYPRPAPIPAGVDPACYYADLQGVSCDDVKQFIQDYFKLNHPEVLP